MPANKNILRSFFSSGLQAIAVQVLGVLFFAVVADALTKDEFGIVNWASATAVFITTVLSFGMEQVIVRRIASGSSGWAAAAVLFHNFVGSVLAFAIILLLGHLYADPGSGLFYLPLFFAAQSITFLFTPLKQFLNAKHIFTPYGIIAVFSNLCKIALAIYLVKTQRFNITNTGSILIFCASIELLALLAYVYSKTDFRLKFRFIAYVKLVKESMPQYLAVIFDSSLSRLDWILLGLISTNIAIGDYSFAYKAYEVARLPIVIIAPVILNIFARMLASGGRMAKEKQVQVRQIYKVEIFGAMFIPLVLNIIWVPVLDYAFDGKYGNSNAVEFMLLSLCVPLHFFTNLMWTIGFSARKYRKITIITMLTALANLLLNLILIPLYGGLGAAIAYLITTLFQAVAYYLVINRHIMRISLFPLFRYMALAGVVYIFVQFIPGGAAWKMLAAIAAYPAICLALRWIRPGDIMDLKQMMSR